MSDLNVSLSTACAGCGKTVAVAYLWHQGMIVPQASCIDVNHLEWDEEKKQLITVETMPDLHHLILCQECRIEFVGDVLACLMRIQDKMKAPAQEPSVTVN